MAPEPSPPGFPGAVPPPRLPDYELVRCIGRGAYGDVWLARGRTGTWRAVKVVWRHRFADGEPYDREFQGLKEFSAVSLSEAGQLALLHVGADEGAGYFYYVMELADDATGSPAMDPDHFVPLTLKELKARRGRLPVDECVAIAVGLARALVGLHSRGLLHRDIKPSNIILVHGVPKLADIGLVASGSATQTGVGTTGFLPPEGAATPAGDVYAFGKVIYELATGLDREEFPRLPADLGTGRERRALFELNVILLRACEPEAARRYPDASALLADLELLNAGRSLLRRRRRARLIRVTAAVVVGLVVGIASWWRGGRAPPPGAPSVAVLPFENLSDDRQNEYFSEGISEDVTNLLAKVPGLKVAGRTSAFHFKGRKEPVAEIARQLGVAYVVEGSVRKSGSKVRITAQLIKAADGFQVYNRTYDRELADIFSVQEEIAGLIIDGLRPVLLPAEAGLSSLRPVAQGRPTENVEAYRLLLEGRFYLNQRTEESLPHAAQLFHQAVQLDPHFALGWANLAFTYGWMYSFWLGNYEETVVPGLVAGRRAVELDPNLATAQAGLAGVAVLAFDWQTALTASRKGVALAPHDTEVLQTASFAALATGDIEGTVNFAQRAIEVDPLNLAAYVNLLAGQRGARHYPEAEATLRRMDEINPNNGMARSEWIDVAQGKYAAILARYPERSTDTDMESYWRAFAYQGLGNKSEADRAYGRLTRDEEHAYIIALLQAFRGEREAAFASLEVAWRNRGHGLVTIKTDHLLDSLHSDPRWRDLLGRMGLLDEQLARIPRLSP